MKFLFLFILASSATLAASAGSWDEYYTNSPYTPGPKDSPRVVRYTDRDPESIYSRQPFNKVTDSLKLGEVSFQEAKKKLEDELDANASDNTLVHVAFKYKTYSDWLARLAKVKDDRGFLVVLDLLNTYHIKSFQELKEEDRGLLDVLGHHEQDAFLTAAAEPDFFMMDLLHKWGNINFGKLVEKAMAEGHNSVDSLLKDERTHIGIASLWDNFEPDTKLPDLVGPHLLEYAMKKFGTSADDKATPNRMLIAMFQHNHIQASSLLCFMALLVRADGATKGKALELAFRLPAGHVRQFVVAALLASGKLEIREGFDYGFHEEKGFSLRALCERDIRIRRVWAKKHMALAKQHEAQAEQYNKPKDRKRKHDEAYETTMLSMNLQPSTFNLGGTSNLPGSNSAQSIYVSEALREKYKNVNFGVSSDLKLFSEPFEHNW